MSIPERYKNMGFTKVGQKKDSTRPGKKWMVLAKKGDQYKVVHGGYTGMKDYTQHHDDKRKERFWDRMGGKNSAKAKDPFSPLYWHKKLGTWEQGGMINNEYIVNEDIMNNYRKGGSTWSGNAWYQPGGSVLKSKNITKGEYIMPMGPIEEIDPGFYINPKSPAKEIDRGFYVNPEVLGDWQTEGTGYLRSTYPQHVLRSKDLIYERPTPVFEYGIHRPTPLFKYGKGGDGKPKPKRETTNLEKKNQESYFFQGFNPVQQYYANQMYDRYGKVVMTDKANNRTYYGTKKPDGAWDINEFEVLTGKQSDPKRQEVNPYTLSELDERPGDRITPIGVFPLQYSSNTYGVPGYGIVGSSSNPKITGAYHVTFEGADDMTRKYLYNNKSAKDNYRSYGCINCEKPSIENLVRFVGTDNDDFTTIIDSRLKQEEIDEWMKKNTPTRAYTGRSKKYDFNLPDIGLVASDNTRIPLRPTPPLKQDFVLQQPVKSTPSKTQAPVKTVQTAKTPIKNTPVQQIPVKSSQPVVSRPTPTGSVSVVDYLASRGEKFDKTYRAQLAKELGIDSYDYSASKNLELLSRLKKRDSIERDMLSANAAALSNVKYGGTPCYECGGMYAYGGNTLPYFQGDIGSSQYGPDDDISYIEQQEAMKSAQSANKLRTFVNPDDDNFYGDEYKFPALDEGPPTLEDWYAQQQAQQATAAQAQQQEQARKEEAAKEAKAAEPVVQTSGKSKPSYKVGSPKDPSIVNFLYSRNKPFDFETRAQIAASKGITNYKGTAAQNTYLLAILRAEEAKTNPNNQSNNQNAPEDPQIQQSMDLYNQAAQAQESGDPNDDYWTPNIPDWLTTSALGAAGLYGANKVFQRYGPQGPNAPWLRQMRDFEAGAKPKWRPNIPSIPNVAAKQLNFPAVESFKEVPMTKEQLRQMNAARKKAIAEQLKKEAAEQASKKSSSYWDDALRFGTKVIRKIGRKKLEYGGDSYLQEYQGAKGSSQVNDNVFDDVYNYLDNHNVLDHLWNVPMLWKNKQERAERIKEWGDKFPTNVMPFNNTETVANIGQYFIPYYGAGLLGTQVASAFGARNLSDEDKAVEAVATALPYGAGKAFKPLVKRAAKLVGRKNGGPAVGEVMDVTPQQAEILRQQGYTFENI